MNTILTIIKKEIMGTLRDKRTLISAILIPALTMPLLIIGVTKLQKSLLNEESTKKLKIALYDAPRDAENIFKSQGTGFEIVPALPFEAAKDSVTAEKYDAIVSFDKNFNARVDSMRPGNVSLYYKSTNIMVEDRLTAQLEQYKAGIMDVRLKKMDLSPEIFTPVNVKSIDVASKKEQIGIMVGGLLPYIFIIFCFIGCLYPALDLITGEKEKGTIETLLTVPASRFDILIGKVATIAIIGVCAAFMTIAGMYITLKLINELPKEILATINDMMSIQFVVMLFAMLIPLSLFFAGMISAIAIRAASFKEAQSYVTPLMFVVIVPAMIALMPGVKLSWQTAFIPILNVALATKEIIAGTIHYSHYFAIVLSLVLLAFLAVLISVRQFSNEKNILK